ncbi:DUF2141 domain-containing protein [Pseudoteredinibacter isoporae]|uniref:DUF2141 domain-containing protein n=1 Tax=Pseudoteredinibacter isoporae TaxID=570281 RepID=UPI003101C58B
MKSLSKTSTALTSIITLLGLYCSPFATAEQNQHQLTLLIKGYEESTGTTYLSLYDKAEHFNKMDGKSVANVQQRISGDTLRITFHDLNSGQYAVSLYHDANNNRELDRNMLGIPSEPYGFSNDAGAFGPAKFNKASFTLEADKTIVINLR